MVHAAMVLWPHLDTGLARLEVSKMKIYAHTGEQNGKTYLRCNACGKKVSSLFTPVANEIGVTLVVRAWIECPECMELGLKEK